MTTPSTMNSILVRLGERLADAEGEVKSSSKAAMNSYGAGYDAGFAAALRETITDITGDEPSPRDRDQQQQPPTKGLNDVDR